MVTRDYRSKEDEVTNPFEDENGIYHVLINDEGQHSLWPSFIEVPDGWTIIHQSDSRAACLDFINRNWTDMRPNSLIERMKKLGEGDQQANERVIRGTATGWHCRRGDKNIELMKICQPNQKIKKPLGKGTPGAFLISRRSESSDDQYRAITGPFPNRLNR